MCSVITLLKFPSHFSGVNELIGFVFQLEVMSEINPTDICIPYTNFFFFWLVMTHNQDIGYIVFIEMES